MRVSKGKAFLLSLVSILAISLGALFFGADEEGVAQAGLTAVVALATVFITGNVADNGVKGKYFQEGLSKKE